MKIAFVVDPLDSFKIYKDTTFAIMREAAARGHKLFAMEQEDLALRRGTVYGSASRLHLTGKKPMWYRREKAAAMPLKDFDAVLMRKDPPFDMEYVYSTYLLELAEAQGARVFNRPRAIRDWNEKMGCGAFPAVRAAHRGDPARGAHPRVPRRAARRDPEAARRHGRRLRVPRAPRRSQRQRHHRDRDALRAAHDHGAALHRGDPRRRQARAADRRQARAALPCAHPQAGRDARQPRRRRHGRRAQTHEARPRDRRGRSAPFFTRKACCWSGST